MIPAYLNKIQKFDQRKRIVVRKSICSSPNTRIDFRFILRKNQPYKSCANPGSLEMTETANEWVSVSLNRSLTRHLYVNSRSRWKGGENGGWLRVKWKALQVRCTRIGTSYYSFVFRKQIANLPGRDMRALPTFETMRSIL